MITYAKNSSQLRDRIVHYVDARGLREREALRTVIFPEFAALGRAVIIGGMPRDIARRGAKGFSSDIDIVVMPTDYGRYLARMQELQGKPNRFGGYGLKIAGWHVDVWALPDTWALKMHLRPVRDFCDLLSTTFFDLDAVLYDIDSRKIIAPDNYFKVLSSGVIGLNLVENPNPLGSALRALRRALAWDVRLTSTLADYVLGAIEMFGWEELLSLDNLAFSRPFLKYEEQARIVGELRNRQKMDTEWVSGRLALVQEQLDFNESLRQYAS